MKWWKLKERLKAISVKQWIFISFMTITLFGGVACAIVALYMSGHTIGSWMGKYYPWIILAIVIVYFIVMSIVLFKKRKI